MSNPTAKQTYEARMKRIKEQLTSIRKELGRHERRFKGHEQHWGYPEDLADVEEKLRLIEAFLKNEDTNR